MPFIWLPIVIGMVGVPHIYFYDEIRGIFHDLDILDGDTATTVMTPEVRSIYFPEDRIDVKKIGIAFQSVGTAKSGYNTKAYVYTYLVPMMPKNRETPVKYWALFMERKDHQTKLDEAYRFYHSCFRKESKVCPFPWLEDHKGGHVIRSEFGQAHELIQLIAKHYKVKAASNPVFLEWKAYDPKHSEHMIRSLLWWYLGALMAFLYQSVIHSWLVPAESL